MSCQAWPGIQKYGFPRGPWIMKKKKPANSGGFYASLDCLGSCIGGGGGNRTPVRKYSTAGSSCGASDFLSPALPPKGRMERDYPESIRLPPSRPESLAIPPVLRPVRPGGHDRQNVSRLTRLRRIRSRLRLFFSYLFNEACRNLGTLLQLQLSPSKPLRPHKDDFFWFAGIVE